MMNVLSNGIFMDVGKVVYTSIVLNLFIIDVISNQK